MTMGRGVPGRGVRRALLLAVIALLSLGPAAPGRGALPKQPDAAPAPDWLTGQLLVASPDIGDPRFRHTVILIVRHGPEGALGIVINRPIGRQPIAALMRAIGEAGDGLTGSVQVFAGGPVEPTLGSVLHTADYHGAGTVPIDGRVAMTATPDVLRDIGHGHGPRHALVAFGYAGWAPGQLEHELTLRGWFTEPEDPALVFDTARDRVWDDAMAHRTVPL